MIKKFYSKKYAFTLSEVLLTMTLIGFLATMTLSTVGASIQQRARLAEFRTAYAKMDAAIRSITLDDSKIYSCYLQPSTTDKTNFKLEISGTVSDQSAECATLMHSFVRAMGLTRTCETNPVTEGCLSSSYPDAPEGFSDYTTKSNAYVLDNSMIIFDDNKKYLQQFAIDVNGRKGPNKWGQDIFPFSLKATESKVVFGNTFVTAVGFLPPNIQTSYDAKASKTTLEMIKESAGKK